MGYTTDFSGQFRLNKPLTVAQKLFLEQFAHTRRMKRNGAATEKLDDPARLAVGLPIGNEGAYYVGDSEDFGQKQTPDILNYNSPPAGQPGLWCQWVPTEDGMAIEHDGGEKFYDYVEWITYLIEHFLKPWGHVLNGEVTWQGEESSDIGEIVVKKNVVKTKQGRIVYS